MCGLNSVCETLKEEAEREKLSNPVFMVEITTGGRRSEGNVVTGNKHL